MVRKTPLLICILFLSAATALNAHRFEPGGRADSSSESPGEHISKPASDPIADIEARAGQAKSTSETPPPTRPFSSIATPVRDYPRVASSGVCAPHYKNGTRGRCIANKPCRGYGIRNDKNEVLCMCYLTHGGCDAKSRCDDRAHACVADSIQKNKEE
jgi:hypothetical protein